MSEECTDKDKCHESGQGLNPNSALDQALNPASSNRSAESHSGRGDVPGSVSTSPGRQYELRDVNQYHNTVQVDLGANSATEQYSSGAKMVVGSSLAYPGMVNAPLRDCADIQIYDINHADVEEKFANSIIHFNQFTDQSMVCNPDNGIFRLGSSLWVSKKCLKILFTIL